MSAKEYTPIWFELRKEYIDDNYEKLLGYLQKNSIEENQDTFFIETNKLFMERIASLLEELRDTPIYEEDKQREKTLLNVKLLALYLLIDTKSTLAVMAYIALMGELKVLYPKYSDALIKNTVKRLTHESLSSLGYSWSDLSRVDEELFAHKASKAVFENQLQRHKIYENNGTVVLTQDGLFLINRLGEDAEKIVRNGASSIDTGIGMTIRTSVAEKIKKEKHNNMPEMIDFTKQFIDSMQNISAKKSTKRLAQYVQNDETLVKITKIDYNGTMYVETVDPYYHKIEGTIYFDQPYINYYYTSSLYNYFKVGDCFKATLMDIYHQRFSINKQLKAFLVEDSKENSGEGDLVNAVLIDPKENNYIWLDEYGIPLCTKIDTRYKKGDFACLSITYYGQGNKYGKIYAEIEDDAEDHFFDEAQARKECIEAFASFEKQPETIEINEAEKLDPMVLHLLLRQLFIHQKTLLKPSERYALLANANVIAEIIGDKISASYIEFNSTYLQALVQFVNNSDMRAIALKPDDVYKQSDATQIRLSVVELLKKYGEKDHTNFLDETIQQYKDTRPMLAQLAQLIQIANTLKGKLSDATINLIKREIIKNLSIETEYDADLEADGNSYLGIESGTQEFKTSIIYPSANNMQPNEKEQNHNVLKGICAFLNSTTGGTLYIGVNDQGYVVGIKNDMDFLHHHTHDSYMRYIQNVIKQSLGIDVLPYINIKPMYNDAVIAINILPHPYRVVELSGKAYLRVNAESREMPENMKSELISEKMLKNKEQAATISQLQHAYSQRKCVVLHNYASSNSGSVGDRFVEIYEFLLEDKLVVGYEHNATTDSKIKVFNICRIGYVEIKENEPWQYEDEHKSIEVDDFHMSGTQNISIQLQLDLFAKNLLVEEFPKTKNNLTQHKGDNNIWYYEAKIAHIEPIARFYLGLANHIEIINAPELKTYVKDFIEKYL